MRAFEAWWGRSDKIVPDVTFQPFDRLLRGVSFENSVPK